jgi:ribosomal-protein-alanine N-acetyltransferase
MFEFSEKIVKVPVLKTQMLELDEISLDDRASIFEIFSNEEVVKYYDVDAFTDVKHAEELIRLFMARIEQSLGIRWAIRLKGEQKCIGTCGFNSWSKPMRSATIGYDLNREYWGQGIMSEALAPVIQYAFDGLLPCGYINRIQADTVPGNIASEKVLRKLGFKEEGLRRQSGYWKNAFHDLKCFGLLKSDFQNNY